MVGNLMAQIQQQRKGKLGNSGSAVVRHITHGDAAFGSGFTVYHIVAGSQNTDQLDIGTGFQNFLCNRRFICKHNTCIANAFCHLIYRCALKNGDVTVLIQKIPA